MRISCSALTSTIRFETLLCGILLLSSTAFADKSGTVDNRFPFRTDSANGHLAWYQPRPLEFPPFQSGRRFQGELVRADFILRKGQFRETATGELREFVLPPYGSIGYLNAEADLRDIPVGTFLVFSLHQDSQGQFTRVAIMQDQFTQDTSEGIFYRLESINSPQGQLKTFRHCLSQTPDSPEQQDLIVTSQTRYWKDSQQVALQSLQPGDELLYHQTGKTAISPGHCTDIWIGRDTHLQAMQTQRKKFRAFNEFRGLPGWVNSTQTQGKVLVVTLFSGAAENFSKDYAEQLVAGKDISVVVANEELRTWNPPVDREAGKILHVENISTEGYGCSGIRVTFKVNNLLEGFRRGRVVRIFLPGWPVKDQFYGESLMGYGFGRLKTQELLENPAREYPEQFPFRTDYGNVDLPWFRILPQEAPPQFAGHLLHGELIEANDQTRSGQFRADGTGEIFHFKLMPYSRIRFLDADASLSEIPLGTRCGFQLFLDDAGAFTIAGGVSDEFSDMRENLLTWRVGSLLNSDGKITVARQIPEVKDYNGDMVRPPDIGRAVLKITPRTRFWKRDQQVSVNELMIGDDLLVNLSGERPAEPSYCTDIWIGRETHKLVSESQQMMHAAGRK